MPSTIFDVTYGASDIDRACQFHDAALGALGVKRNPHADEGAPGTRAYYSPTFYVAYVRDPDGNKLAAAFYHYAAEEIARVQ